MRVLNVAEKPSVAKEIAAILSSGRAHRRAGFSQYNALFEFPYEIGQQRVEMVITSVTGHLMELEFDPKFRGWHSCDPVELFTAPVVKKIRNDDTQKKIEKTLITEARRCEWLVLWLDCDREGENIAFEVKAVCQRASRRPLRVFRARFSALIPRDIEYAVQHLAVPDEKLSRACDARSEIDLRIGAAFTRFQTMRIQSRIASLKKERGGVISYGPCQFPTLGFVVERFLQIQNFEREAFHYLTVTHTQEEMNQQQTDTDRAQSDGSARERKTTTFTWRRGRIYDRTACLCLYESLLDHPVATIVSVAKKPTWKRKPLPLTTVELQKRASRWLRVSSEQTMKAAESLYNKGFISYPRTETNKFKEGTDLLGLVRQHEGHAVWGRYVSNVLIGRSNGGEGASEGGAGPGFETPRAGGGDDQAHPPIHPTKCVGLNSISDPIEKKLYEFVARHFLACCSRDARGDQTNVQMTIHFEQFTATGLMISERNYLDIYKYEKWNASAIPVYRQGDTFEPTSLVMDSGETAPPPLLSEADLIAKMDSNGIGTDATIAEHIKTILKREYAVKVNNDTQFKPTTLGLALVLSYEHMGLELAKPALRAAMENDCKAIAHGQKDVKLVIQTCMDQMRAIFERVCRQADLMDSTFLEHFGGTATTTINNSATSSISSPLSTTPVPASRALPGTAPGTRSRRTPERVREYSTARIDSLPSAPTPLPRPQATSTTAIPVDITSEVPRCPDHDLPCVERQVQREGPNTGRYFYVCSLPREEQCSFFAWVSNGDAPPGPASSVRVLCSGHDEPCVERTVKKEGPNKGRYFFVCCRDQAESCGFFQWKDELPANGTAADTNARSSRHPSPGQGDSSTSSSSLPSPPTCKGHHQPSVLRTCRNGGENHGREFYVCASSMNESCGFFVWKADTNESLTSASLSSRRERGQQQPISAKGMVHDSDTHAPKCECGMQAILLVCRNGANKGRSFFKCSGNGQENQCTFFKWAS